VYGGEFGEVRGRVGIWDGCGDIGLTDWVLGGRMGVEVDNRKEDE